MSQRIDQLNSLVQRQVASILQREVEFARGSLVTITRVRVADDAESAKVWISVLPVEEGPAALALINRQIGAIQHILNKRLVMKFVPKLTFVLDTQLVKATTITEVLDSLSDDDLGSPASPV